MARKSDWLVTEQASNPSVKPCTDCDGTGYANKSHGPVCGSCRGFGY